VTGAVDAQRDRWSRAFAETPGMFGEKPSGPGREAADLFRREGTRAVLDLGCGTGRDALHFARQGLAVTAADYSPPGLRALLGRARKEETADRVRAVLLDARRPLPFRAGAFDACYSHMLFCMAFARPELDLLALEARRVLRPGGLHVLTVRHTGDAHCGQGIDRGDGMWEVGGFTVRFFDRAAVERVAAGGLEDLREYEEGGLPRKLWRVILRKG
jgi:SAM-dependent methyltransferase